MFLRIQSNIVSKYNVSTLKMLLKFFDRVEIWNYTFGFQSLVVIFERLFQNITAYLGGCPHFNSSLKRCFVNILFGNNLFTGRGGNSAAKGTQVMERDGALITIRCYF